MGGYNQHKRGLVTYISIRQEMINRSDLSQETGVHLGERRF
jgi:hypothetical protein